MINLIDIPILRSLTWRMGRRLYSISRRDVSNCPEHNGEYWLLKKLLHEIPSNQTPVLMDIGANKGNWTTKANEILEHENKSAEIYAFEPAKATYEFLSQRFKTDECVKLNNLAFSDTAGEADFFVVEALAGTNSFYGERCCC